MGVCSSRDVAEELRSRRIERECKKQYKKESSDIKLLLLGGGGSGKSTFFKQIINTYGDGFGDDERELYIPVIHENVIQSMSTLLEYSRRLADSHPELDTKIRENAEKSKIFFEDSSHDSISLALAAHIQVLWRDRGIQNTYRERYRFLLDDSTFYFMEKVQELADPQYWPCDNDLFRVRLRTTGIIESSFSLEGRHFTILDVGGQKNERKKWIHCFSHVSAVLFVASLTGYSQICFEDHNRKRLSEALEIFDFTLSSRHLKDCPFILFLNKKDLLQECLNKVPLSTYFPDYEGGDKYDDAIKHISKQFQAIAMKEKGHVFVHLTCATDSGNVKRVFNDVKEFILEKSLSNLGLM